LPRHDNLVQIEGFGYCPQKKTWYLVMEYVDGPTLESYLARKGPLNEAQVRQVFTHVIEGLARAHQAGIVHRDIKPGNLIFRCRDQRLVLVDFGLAVEMREVGRTQVGGLTVSFAAPEQHYGEPATQASDVFSLCAVMHYALTYDKPEQRLPHRYTPALAPESLRLILSRGLATTVTERPTNAGELLELVRGNTVGSAHPDEICLGAIDLLELDRGNTVGSEPVPKSLSVSTGRTWKVDLGGMSLPEAVNQAQPGDVIELAPGEYILDEPLVIDKSLMLRGSGREQTRIHSEAEGFALKFTGDAQGTLQDVTVEHTGHRPAHVVVVDSGMIRIERCSMRGGVSDETRAQGGDGIWLTGTARGIVKECVCSGNGLHGIGVWDQAQPTLQQNTCENNKHSGIAYEDEAAGSAINNTCRGNGDGIGVAGQAQPVFQQNTCENNKGSGIAYFRNAAGFAKNNSCRGNGRHGIEVSGQAQPVFQQNTCENNKQDGIAYFDNAAGSAINNTCRDNVSYGIYVAWGAQPYIRSNTLEDNRDADYSKESFVGIMIRKLLG
jgi:parallel beta-helix repeat protein